ncbi:MAG: cytochrome c-type biogenesis CcmF C-terminal domain-containing protein, partial [Myxococcota bacterium]|nr:cytochrome c-type biogenesis CcmF C-terminal domain-containing protein [Myxococcota bacterium]
SGSRDLGVLEPRFNRYKKRGDEVPTPAVHTGPKEDLYLSLLRVDDDGTASLRVVVQPMVAWLWVGGLMMVFGSFIASFPERILRRRPSVEAQGDAA